jgi:hypothetical protein
MSKQIKARPMNRSTDVRTGARQVLLAGIGAASLLRKNAGKSWAEATAIAGRMPEATSILIEGLGERSQAFRDELIERARAAKTNLVADMESRLQPLLRKFGETTVSLGIVVSRQRQRGAEKKARKPVKTVAKHKPRKAA